MRGLRTDLVLVAVAAVLAAVVVLLVPADVVVLRAPAAILLLLVLPGYALTAAFLPPAPLRPAERTLLAVGLSLVVAVLTALALYAAGVDLTADAWAVALGVLSAGLALAGQARGGARALHVPSPGIPAAQVAALVAALALAGGAAALGFTPLRAPGDTPGTTALWLLPDGATAAQVGVRSGQLRDAAYTVDVTVAGEAPERFGPIRLSPGDTWTRRIPVPAGRRVDAVLRSLRSPDRVYRRVVLRGDRAAPSAAAQAPSVRRCRAPHPLRSASGCYRVVVRDDRAFRFYRDGRIVPIRGG